MKNINLKSIIVFSAVLGSVFMTGCTTEEEAIAPTTDARISAASVGKGAPKPGSSPIAQIAIDAGFTELVSALVYVDSELKTGLVDLFMNGTDQYTVFAPTDAAFQNLYSALNVASIEELPATLVRDVLLYHVVEGRRASNSVLPKVGIKKISTLLDVEFTVNPQGQITAIGNTANITSANISASNGIIHVIDAVILPIN